jgi:hypothetical protein
MNAAACTVVDLPASPLTATRKKLIIKPNLAHLAS